ncbi:hypothetical protein ES705_41555 [subsurface metagenome]
MKSSIIPLPKGPGLYNASKAVISSMFSGFNLLTKSLIPSLSNWKTPAQFPLDNILYTFLSSKGILFISTSSPRVCFIIFKALLITVKVRSPKKSIFNNPSSSNSAIAYWVHISPSAVFCRGM